VVRKSGHGDQRPREQREEKAAFHHAYLRKADMT
jgi:hypothetical protein